VCFETIHQADYAVVLQLQAFSQASDTGLRLIAKRASRKKQLVLLGFQSCGSGHIVAATKKKPDAIAQLRQRSVFVFVDWSCHGSSISEYDMRATSPVLQCFWNTVNILSVENPIPPARTVANWSLLVPRDVIGRVLSRHHLRQALTETDRGTAAQTQ
jgi:hypothetical protein